MRTWRVLYGMNRRTNKNQRFVKMNAVYRRFAVEFRPRGWMMLCQPFKIGLDRPAVCAHGGLSNEPTTVAEADLEESTRRLHLGERERERGI